MDFELLLFQGICSKTLMKSNSASEIVIFSSLTRGNFFQCTHLSTTAVNWVKKELTKEY